MVSHPTLSPGLLSPCPGALSPCPIPGIMPIGIPIGGGPGDCMIMRLI